MVLNRLDRGDFYTLQGIRMPTPAVVAGLEIACLMLGVKPQKKVPDNIKMVNDTNNFFLAAKQHLLNDPAGFMNKMKTYDKQNMREAVYKRVKAIFAAGNITLEKATQASSCLVGIYKWAEAMTIYHEILKANPKKKELDAMHAMLKLKRIRL